MNWDGLGLDAKSSALTVISGKRLHFREEKQSLRGEINGLPSVYKKPGYSTQHQVFDGERMREYFRYAQGDDEGKEHQFAILSLAGPDNMRLFRAHTFVFRGDRNRQSLATFLKSGSFDTVNNYGMDITYAGDELVGDLHCHKLKCTLPNASNPSLSIYFNIWLARDRNLLAVRHEWHEPPWHAHLPTGITFVDRLREIRPGVWFPDTTTMLAFQKTWRKGGRDVQLMLQWRRDIQVKSMTIDPALDDIDFSSVPVDAGTQVSVFDSNGKVIVRYTQTEPGNIEITPETLLEFRQRAQVIREKALNPKK